MKHGILSKGTEDVYLPHGGKKNCLVNYRQLQKKILKKNSSNVTPGSYQKLFQGYNHQSVAWSPMARHRFQPSQLKGDND